ncbi:unnamed protein product [Gulo gulo]|uniref:Uncharacterized protein n=1 Tax=Gulo gulo TaxID=48420 RepID=A0A9X9PXJ5_GULGU|nr:unnamed protein product [Gulo gulo]
MHARVSKMVEGKRVDVSMLVTMPLNSPTALGNVTHKGPHTATI